MPFTDLPIEALGDYRSSDPDPPDFDTFWQATLSEGRRLPIEAKFERVEAGLPAIEVYDVTYAGYGGHPIKGWYMRPPGAKGLTAVVKYIGYNGGRGFPHEHLLWPVSGRAVLVMDTRGQGSGWMQGWTADPVGSHAAQAGFMTRGILEREQYFYRRVFVDAVRAVEAVSGRAEVDAGKLVVTGGSQGGGMTLAVAGLLGKGVRAAMPDVPFLCHFTRGVGIATRDPYGEIGRFLSVHRDKKEAVFRTLSYFDGVNFARRASAPAIFSVALMDDICPPSTVYAAYNAYGGDKRIELYTYNNHEGGGPHQDRAQLAWLAAQGL